MNKVILMGRLTRDPDVRYTQGEEPMAIARFTLAVDRRGKRDGEASADFPSCVCFRRTGLRHRSESNQIISARHAGRRRSKGETNMGLMDAITAEDRVQLKVSDLEALMKNAAKADLIFNGIRAEVPHRYMREIITGKKEEDADETKASKETEGQEHETTD